MGSSQQADFEDLGEFSGKRILGQEPEASWAWEDRMSSTQALQVMYGSERGG